MAGKGNHGSPGRRSSDFPGSSQGHSEEAHEGLKESAQEMASHLGETAGQMKDRAREYVSGMAGQAQEAWRGAREGMQERFSRYSEKAGDIWGDGIDFVRRYPMASLAAALGLGCLLTCAMFAMSRSTDEVADHISLRNDSIYFSLFAPYFAAAVQCVISSAFMHPSGDKRASA